MFNNYFLFPKLILKNTKKKYFILFLNMKSYKILLLFVYNV